MKKSCWRWLLPLGLLSLLLLGGFGAYVTKHWIQPNLLRDTASLVANDPGLPGVHIDSVGGQRITMSGPASLQANATALVKGHYGVDDVIYNVTTEPASAAAATPVAPAATAATAAASTAAPATTAAPAPATTVAPAPATTVAPVPATTVAPKACPALPTLTGVNFETSSAVLAADAPAKLDAVVAALKAAAGCKISVIGHTDNRGSDESNQALSEARAKSVVDYLVSKGVPAANLTSIGKGESEPVAGTDQNTEIGLAANRRIEFKPTNLGS